MAVTRYFLGGNTASGFVSFYGQFCRGPEDFLWVIKGCLLYTSDAADDN